ncbi:MAG TPA: TIGR04255 family protein [Syntrophobacteraceae bacterium]|nr:TIGR04255 family protein [Syntrophobacteraceae bacterium]
MRDPDNEIPLPNFENPPVIEVVCGVLYKPISAFLTPYLGLLWNEFRPEYPECREVAPLDPILEEHDELSRITVEIANVPPLPRIWFIREKGNEIIQVQRDRFLHNWRKTSPKDEYPRYDYVKRIFFDRLVQLRDFLTRNELGEIDPLQYEMTYINHIPQGEGWRELGQIGEVFPDFAFRIRKRFLPEPSGINWQTTFILPEKHGRLHARIRYVRMRETKLPMLVLELTVRGIGEDKSFQGMQAWFDLAREWIVKGFADLTGSDIQRSIWKRQN